VLTRGIEFEDFVCPFRHRDGVIVPRGDRPELTRFTVNDSGELVEGRTLSFAGVGYSSAFPAGRARIIDDQKAYAFNEANGFVSIWHPTEMRLAGRAIRRSPLVHSASAPVKPTSTPTTSSTSRSSREAASGAAARPAGEARPTFRYCLKSAAT
jgi:hypothetical protein